MTTHFKAWRQWAGDVVVCLASGPSMTQADADYVRGKARIITVNSTYRLAPWADAHYSSDGDWWALHWDAIAEQCKGQLWTGDPKFSRPGINQCPYDKRGRGLSARVGTINWGGNSGYCAIGLAHQFGAARIVLLGYDQQDLSGHGHWHGQHPESIRKAFNFRMWHERFAELAADARRLGIDIVNCSRETALECFDRKALEDVL